MRDDDEQDWMHFADTLSDCIADALRSGAQEPLQVAVLDRFGGSLFLTYDSDLPRSLNVRHVAEQHLMLPLHVFIVDNSGATHLSQIGDGDVPRWH